jgi:hypothetical protein
MYNSDAQGQEGGGQQSIASLMAQQGRMTENDKVIIPNVSGRSEVKAEEQSSSAVEPKSAASANEVQPQSQVPETKSDNKEPVKWQEVLKNQQPDEILKELGYSSESVSFMSKIKDADPKILHFLDLWKTDANAFKDYVSEMNADYAQLSSEEVMRRQLKEEYPKASEKQLEAIFKRDVVDKYNLDSADDELVEDGKLLLDAVAEKYREKLVEKQKELLLPSHVQEQINQEELAKKEFENYQNTLLNSQMTKELLQNKILSIGDGEDKFNYSLSSPEAVVNNLFDSNSWANKMFDIVKDANGVEQFVPNIEKQLLISAILEDHKGFLKEMSKHYKSLGGKSFSDSLDNPSNSGNYSPSKPATEPKSPAEWMAKSGRLIN